MSTLDTFLERNETFAKTHDVRVLMPSFRATLQHAKAAILGCADMRVDPAHVLGFLPGEVVVLRNIGGRVTPQLLEELALLGRIAEVAEAIPGGGDPFNFIVMQHTDCGITRLANDAALLATYFEVDASVVQEKNVLDPRKAVALDVAMLRDAKALPAPWLLSGLVYDVETGKAEIVVPPAPAGAA